MTATTIARAAADPDLQARVIALAHKEILYNESFADSTFGKQLSTGMIQVQPLMWPIAVDTEAAYETAVNTGRGAPGYDVDIITDAALTSAITVHWPYTDAEQVARAGTVSYMIEDLTVTLTINDGIPGATYAVDWGDGYSDSPALDAEGNATVPHLYVEGMWVITVTASNGVDVPAATVQVPPPAPPPILTHH